MALDKEVSERISGLTNQANETALKNILSSQIRDLLKEGFHLEDIVAYHKELVDGVANKIDSDIELAKKQKSSLILNIQKADLSRLTIDDLQEITYVMGSLLERRK